MSITYSIEIDNSKFENLQEGINKITETVYEAGRKLIEQMIEEMDKIRQYKKKEIKADIDVREKEKHQ